MIYSLLVLLIILIIYNIINIIKNGYDNFSIQYNSLIHTDLDGNDYYVHTKHEDMQVAANTFAIINKTVTDVINYIYDKYRNSYNKKRRNVARLLMNRYNANSLRENSPLNNKGDTSYTLNKGDIIAICIRSSKQYNQIHDIEVITFVVLHEITHLSIESYDHPDEFWEVFKFILIEAETAGLYFSPDFERHPKEYCGININYNPRYDINIKSI